MRICYLYQGTLKECIIDPEADSAPYQTCISSSLLVDRTVDPEEEVIITDRAEYVQELVGGFSLCGF